MSESTTLKASLGQPGGAHGTATLWWQPVVPEPVRQRLRGNRGDAHGIAALWWPHGQGFRADSSTSSDLLILVPLAGEQRSATPKGDEPGVARVAAHDRRVGAVAQCRLIQAQFSCSMYRVCGLWKVGAVVTASPMGHGAANPPACSSEITTHVGLHEFTQRKCLKSHALFCGRWSHL